MLFLYKNLFYKNVEAEINQNYKNVLRTLLRLKALLHCEIRAEIRISAPVKCFVQLVSQCFGDIVAEQVARSISQCNSA